MPTSMKHLSEPGSKFVTCLLAKWSDGKHYKAKVIQCDNDNDERRCLVKFEDNTQTWMTADELHAQLQPDHVNTIPIVCCACDGDHSDSPNEIILCDQCQQGYHISCHNPPIDREQCKLGDEDEEWLCNTCTDLLNPRSQSTSKASSQRSTTTPKRKKSRKSMPSTVPKVKLNKKRINEPSKKSIKLEQKDDVEILGIVELQGNQQPSIEETTTSTTNGDVENAKPEISKIAKVIVDLEGALTSDILEKILDEGTNPTEEKVVELVKEKKVTRKNRKPVVAPAS